MEENEKQEPTLNSPPDQERLADHLDAEAAKHVDAPDFAPPGKPPIADEAAPHRDMPSVQDTNTYTTEVAAEEAPLKIDHVSGHPTAGEHGQRLIAGFRGKLSNGAVIDRAFRPAKIEVALVVFRGVEVNNFDIVEPAVEVQSMAEAEAIARRWINAYQAPKEGESNV